MVTAGGDTDSESDNGSESMSFAVNGTVDDGTTSATFNEGASDSDSFTDSDLDHGALGSVSDTSSDSFTDGAHGTDTASAIESGTVVWGGVTVTFSTGEHDSDSFTGSDGGSDSLTGDGQADGSEVERARVGPAGVPNGEEKSNAANATPGSPEDIKPK